MSHEVLRDLRTPGPPGQARVDRPVCDGVSAEPATNPGRAGVPRRFWRAAAWCLVAALTAFVVWAVVTYQSPDRSKCAHLLELSQRTPDVAAEIEAAGCVDADLDLTARP